MSRAAWRTVVVDNSRQGGNDALRRRLIELEQGWPLKDESAFLISPAGRVDPWLSQTFTSRAWKRLAPATRRSYIDSIRRFFDFVWVLDNRDWRQATEDDYDEYEEFRTDSENSAVIVQPATWMKDHSAITWIYTRAHRAGKSELGPSLPGIAATGPNYYDGTRVRHTDPSTARHWRDVAFLGYAWNGVPQPEREPAQSLRNAAFFDLLLDTGLRAGEAHSLTVLNRPRVEAKARIGSDRLPGSLSKSKEPRFYYYKASTVSRIDSYIDGPRNTAIGIAARKGLYSISPGWERATTSGASENPTLTLTSPQGQTRTRRLSQLSILERSRILILLDNTWQPLALWLTKAGLPLQLNSWQSVYRDGNTAYSRSAPHPETSLYLHMHMLRHTFAMVKLLAYERLFDTRFGLSTSQRRDYAEIFGDPYAYVQNLLGHSSSETTKAFYLSALMDIRHRGVLEHDDYVELDPSIEHASLSLATARHTSGDDPRARQ